jgi:hypothetical protein
MAAERLKPVEIGVIAAVRIPPQPARWWKSPSREMDDGWKHPDNRTLVVKAKRDFANRSVAQAAL